MSENSEDLQDMLNKIHAETTRWELTINTWKNKIMVVSTLERPSIEWVERFKYLGRWANNSMDTDIEIKSRIEQAGAAVLKLKSLISNPYLKLQTREKFTRCYFGFILLYGCETLKIQTMNTIEAFQMRTYRRLKIPWIESRMKLLRRIRHARKLLTSIKRR